MAQPAGIIINELWKQVTVNPQAGRTLYEFVKDFKDFMIARNMTHLVLLDVDQAMWHLHNPPPWPIMYWDRLTPEHKTGDQLVRHLLLSNVDRDVRLTVEHLQHASEVWRSLQEVT